MQGVIIFRTSDRAREKYARAQTSRRGDITVARTNSGKKEKKENEYSIEKSSA